MGKSSEEIGEVAENVTSSSPDLAKAVTASSEAAGAAMSVAEIEKFKMHKDNPTQRPGK